MVSVCSPIKQDNGKYNLVPPCDTTTSHDGINCSLTVDNTFVLFNGNNQCGTYSTKEACYKAAARNAHSKTLSLIHI